MRKHFILTILSAILFFASASLIGSTVSASTDGDMLITVGGKTITENMTISEIKNLFGEPKLETNSYWGGKACTFYGTDYSDYLYIETNAEGKILGYGSVSQGFKTTIYSYGQKPDNYVRTGTEAKDYNGNLFGAVYYTEYRSDAYRLFNTNFTNNNRNLCLHAVEMWNAVSYIYGNNTPTTYNEAIFNINSQLAENGSSLYDYVRITGQSSAYQLISSSSAISFPDAFYPNPLMFAKHGRYYNCDGGTAGFTMIKSDDDDDGILVGFCSTVILKEWNSVSLTDHERQLAETAANYMKDSVKTYNSAESYYEITPSYESAESIIGGKLNRKIAIGAVGLLNAIRVGGGLPPVEYSEELSEAAQCKSTYTVFLTQQGVSSSDPHNPPKVEGISDEFFQKCQMGSSENLFMCGYISTSILGSITNALDDSAGDGQMYSRGHRYNLIDPGAKYIGLGNTEQQGCHKMSDRQSYNVDVVAWPSNGITVIGSGFSPSTMWTCKFYNGMKPTGTTTIDIQCLNSGDIWHIDPSNLTDKQAFRASGSLLSYQDKTISFRKGGVYQISFNNLTNTEGNLSSYSYRTAYLDLTDDGESESSVSGVTLNKKTIYLEEGTSGKLNALIQPATAENKRIYFTSSAEDTVAVDECGGLTALKVGEARITATTEDGGYKATCTVKVVAKGEHIHNNIKVAAKAATYKAAGNKEYYKCNGCGMFFGDADGENEIAKDSWVLKKLTPKAQKVTVKATKKTVKNKKLKKKAITVAPLKVKGNKGKVTYKLVSGSAKAKKALKLNKKTGKVTVKKKTKKGKYTIKVKVNAKATASGEYKAFNKTVKVTVQVK